jgi:hypothetical protein
VRQATFWFEASAKARWRQQRQPKVIFERAQGDIR